MCARSLLALALALGLASCGPPPLTVFGNGVVTSVDRAVPDTIAVTLACPGTSR